MKIEDMNEPELAELMRGAARKLEEYFRHAIGEKPLFTLLVFNDPAIAQYAANCQRSDIIKALRETADRLSAKEDVTR